MRKSLASIAVSVTALAFLACDGSIGAANRPGSGAQGSEGGSSGTPSIPGSGSTPGTGAAMATGAGGGGGGSTNPGAGGTGQVVVPNDSPLLPARIRRLTNAEFDTSVKSLLGVDSKFGASFTPDTRQDNFSRNDAQRVDPVFITQLDAAAQQIAASVHNDIQNLAPCSDMSAAGGVACARTFLTGFATKAYRRPATSDEVDALVTVYQAGADTATYIDGIQTAIQAVLESPGFIYITELGDAPLAMSALTQYEIASSISYLATGTPPDQALLDAAKAGTLSNADERQSQFERLIGAQEGSPQISRLVEEWLGIDRITQTGKDSNVYPAFAGLRDAMKQEADDFTAEVMWKSGASVSDLFSADWTIADDPLARMYLHLADGVPVPKSGNHVMLTNVPRRGILDQGAFLSVYAHATETGPVLRGVAVLRRIGCDNIPAPSSLNITVVPLVADPSKTMRDRLQGHVKDPVCASCHERIDAVGLSFENLDGMGEWRDKEKENGLAIDSATTLATSVDFAGNFADSTQLSMALAASEDVRTCFARKLFHYAATRSDASVQGVETTFMQGATAMPEAAKGKVKEILTTFVRSNAFVTRRASE